MVSGERKLLESNKGEGRRKRAGDKPALENANGAKGLAKAVFGGADRKRAIHLMPESRSLRELLCWREFPRISRHLRFARA